MQCHNSSVGAGPPNECQRSGAVRRVVAPNLQPSLRSLKMWRLRLRLAPAPMPPHLTGAAREEEVHINVVRAALQRE
jgi:hypothetical protein